MCKKGVPFPVMYEFSDLPFRFTAPSDAIGDGGPVPDAHASLSTWGRHGFLDMWLNQEVAWILRHQHEIERQRAHLLFVPTATTEGSSNKGSDSRSSSANGLKIGPNIKSTLRSRKSRGWGSRWPPTGSCRGSSA